jgi:hypothetical protein
MGDHPRVLCSGGHDHARFIRDHSPGRHACDQKVRRRVGRDRQGELLDIQLDQRHTQNLRTRDPDRVERNIDAARLLDHGLEMLVHSLLVERVDLRRLGRSAGGINFVGDSFDVRPAPPGEKQLGPLARKGTRNSAADRASGP